MSDTTRAPAAGVATGERRGGAEAPFGAGAAEAVRVLVGLDEFEVTGAVELDDGVLEVMVRAQREQAACPRCGTFSGRVKQRRTQRVRDLHSFARPVVLVWHKRRCQQRTNPSAAPPSSRCAHPQPSSPAMSLRGRPRPACRVAHRAARDVKAPSAARSAAPTR